MKLRTLIREWAESQVSVIDTPDGGQFIVAADPTGMAGPTWYVCPPANPVGSAAAETQTSSMHAVRSAA